jgi:nicotinamidase-related amidase
LLDAVDADYRVLIVQDCCADRDADVHAVLVEKFFPQRGTALTAKEFLENLAR